MRGLIGYLPGIHADVSKCVVLILWSVTNPRVLRLPDINAAGELLVDHGLSKRMKEVQCLDCSGEIPLGCSAVGSPSRTGEDQSMPVPWCSGSQTSSPAAVVSSQNHSARIKY